MDKGRLEAFSDGVFAVAITLLVLALAVPNPHRGGDLGRELLSAAHWPHYAAYATSFLTIGIIWINHHGMIRRLRAADHGLLTLNLLLLMTVVVLPFTTDLVATYLTQDYGHALAAGIYAASFLAMACAFATLQRYVLFARPHLLTDAISDDDRRAIWRRNSAGLIPYAVATALAPVSAYATLGLCGAIAVFYALPFAPEDAGF